MTRLSLLALVLWAATAVAQTADVTVTGTAVLDGARLVVTGDLTVATGATLDAESGGIAFTGAGSQSFTVADLDAQPFDVQDFLVDKPPSGEVLVYVRPQITGVLGLHGGQLAFEEGSARLAAVVGGGEVQSLAAVDGTGATLTGDPVDYERPFLDGEGWRLIASPFAGDFTSLNDDFHTQGADGADNPAGDPNVIAWDPTRPDGSRYVGVTNFTQPMAPGRGYFLYAYGEVLGQSGLLPATWDVTGEEHTGTVEVPLSYSPTDPHARYALLGNPYAGPLDWHAVQAAGNFQEAYAVWDPGANSARGAYAYYSTTAGSTGDADRFIPAFQGFWAEATSATPFVLTFDWAWKAIGESPVFVGKSALSALRFHLDGEGLEAPDALALFVAHGEVGRDRADGSWLAPLSQEWAALRLVRPGDGAPLVFDARADASHGHTLELDVETTTPGTYTLTWPETPAGADLVLHDRQTGATVDLAARSSYTFTVSEAVPLARKASATALPVSLKAVAEAPRFEVRVAGGARASLRLDAEAEEVEAGGQIQMEATFAFAEAAPGRVTYWTEAVLPNGKTLGPILKPRTLRATPGTTVAKAFSQRIPSGTAPGAYLYRMMARLPDGHVVAVDEVRLDVAASASKATGEEWTVTDADGDVLAGGGVDDLTAEAGAPDALTALPSEPTLSRPFPNPARGTATVAFALPEAAEVRVSVYDALGREVAVLAEGTTEAGTHTLRLDARVLLAGTYLVRLQTGETVQTERLTLVR